MASAHIQRWALTLSVYNYTIIYKPGSQHGNANLLSKLPLPLPGDTIQLLGKTVMRFHQSQQHQEVDSSRPHPVKVLRDTNIRWYHEGC